MELNFNILLLQRLNLLALNEKFSDLESSQIQFTLELITG